MLNMPIAAIRSFGSFFRHAPAFKIDIFAALTEFNQTFLDA